MRSLSERLKEHLEPGRLLRHTHKNCWLRSLTSDGVDPVIELLEEFADKEKMHEGEIFYIAYLTFVGCSLTNGTLGGDGRRAGWKHTPESRAKMTAALTGRVNSEQSRRKLSAARKGMKFSPETCARLRAAQNPRPILCVNTGIVYETVSDAVADPDLPASSSSIYKVANGDLQQCNGYVFRWADKRDPSP